MICSQSMHSRHRLKKYYPAVNDTMLSGNFQSYRIQSSDSEKIEMKIEKSFLW